jgi:hypothetical protein
MALPSRNCTSTHKPHPLSHLFETIIGLGGGKYRGVQPSFRDKHGNLVEDLILFDSPQTGSTLGLYSSQLNADAVRRKIGESDTLYEQYAEKAATRIFRHFAEPVEQKRRAA